MPGFWELETVELTLFFLVIVLSIAVVTDVRHHRIYNSLTFPSMAAGIALNTVAHGWSGFLFAFSGLVLGVVLFLPMVGLLSRGAGDLKLLAAVGALGGPTFVIWTALWAGVAGGVFAVAVLLARGRLGTTMAGFALDVQSGQFPVARSNIRVPYAVPIAAGAVMALVFS